MQVRDIHVFDCDAVADTNPVCIVSLGFVRL